MRASGTLMCLASAAGFGAGAAAPSVAGSAPASGRKATGVSSRTVSRWCASLMPVKALPAQAIAALTAPAGDDDWREF